MDSLALGSRGRALAHDRQSAQVWAAVGTREAEAHPRADGQAGDDEGLSQQGEEGVAGTKPVQHFDRNDRKIGDRNIWASFSCPQSFCRSFICLGEARVSQGAGAVGGGEVFVEFVGERAVVAGFGEVVPGWWIRGEEGVAGTKPVVEEFTRQRIGEAEGDEGLTGWVPATGLTAPIPNRHPARNHDFAGGE